MSPEIKEAAEGMAALQSLIAELPSDSLELLEKVVERSVGALCVKILAGSEAHALMAAAIMLRLGQTLIAQQVLNDLAAKDQP